MCKAKPVKQILSFVAACFLLGSVQAQVEVLPPDFVLFGKSSGDYCAEYIQFTSTHSTNEDYLFPDASPLSDERVYFLHRPTYYLPTLGIQTYFVPDDAYIYLPIIVINWDNVEVVPPLTPEQLRDTLRAEVDGISAVRLNIDGVQLANPLAYRTESPFFSFVFQAPDNLYSFLLGRSFVGLDDPVIAGGYLVMLKPLPPGLHDVHTAYTFAEPDGFTRERHYQIYSLTPRQFLAHETVKLAGKITDSSLALNRKQPLLASLNAAQTSFSSGNPAAGVEQVTAFEHKLRAQVAPADQALADEWSAAAQTIIDRATARSATVP